MAAGRISKKRSLVFYLCCSSFRSECAREGRWDDDDGSYVELPVLLLPCRMRRILLVLTD